MAHFDEIMTIILKSLMKLKDTEKTHGKFLKMTRIKILKITPLKKVVIRNTEITDNVEIVKAFNGHYASAGEKLAAQIENISINPVDDINKADTKFNFKSIEVCQIIRIIKQLANWKAVGIHSISNESLKERAELIAPSLCAIFSRAIYTQTYPFDLNISEVSAIFNPKQAGPFRI